MLIAALIAGCEKGILGSEQNRFCTRRDIHAALLAVNDGRGVYASIHIFGFKRIHCTEKGTKRRVSFVYNKL